MAPLSQYPPGSHPRRPPAHKSVSLVHSPNRQSHASADRITRRVPSSDIADPPPTISRRSGDHKQSSGESSNAENWFEKSNNDITRNGASILDDEPPFFFRNSSSADTPPETSAQRNPYTDPQLAPLPYRSNLMQLAAEGNSVEEFRSVIDDLTIENKKLKRRLKKYEKMHNVHLQKEKLFEVRVHGLPAHRKKELEETLKKFALGLDDSPTTASSATGYERATAPPPFEPHITTSSYTSTRFADSAYASGSGHNSSAPSGLDNGSRKRPRSATSRQQQDIQSYLRDIPEWLLPKYSAPMSEKAKKKLVVRRLEQIFTGQGAANWGHQQPLQQQEISQSAAKADRSAIEASGRQVKEEGLREARIMPTDSTRCTNPVDPNQEMPGCVQSLDPSTAVAQHDFAKEPSPDQRPTRPLDLDPYRAQVPADNIRYIRHLGFSPPDADAVEPPMDGHGWIYLNLLSNMAQLHTLNVTPEFVRSAITGYSTSLELSPDGRKARWKSGSKETSILQEDQQERQDDDGSSDEEKDAKKVRKGSIRPAPTGSSGSSVTPAKPVPTQSSLLKGTSLSQLAYIPLFFHKTDTDDERDFSESGDSRADSVGTEHDSSGFASSGLMSKRRLNDDGPIIFYNKARFCTDFSGDLSGHCSASHKSLSYSALPVEPVGTTLSSSKAAFDEGEIPEVKGSLAYVSKVDEPKDLEGASSSSEAELTLLSGSTLSDTKSSTSFEATRFEASGVGGVQPADHFAINVESKRALFEGPTPQAVPAARFKAYPRKIQALFESVGDGQSRKPSTLRNSGPVVCETVVSTFRKDLPASSLPPALFYHLESADGSDSDAESDDSEEPSPSDRSLPAAAPRLLNMSLHSTDESSSFDEDDDESDDGSIDLLATAREIDPETIRAREREYDSNMAERLAEEIPAGSSAATAGGGSGFNSPTSAVDGEEGQRRRSSVPKVSGAKRKKADGGPVVQGKAPRLG